jgi:hypothetical protein
LQQYFSNRPCQAVTSYALPNYSNRAAAPTANLQRLYILPFEPGQGDIEITELKNLDCPR